MEELKRRNINFRKLLNQRFLRPLILIAIIIVLIFGGLSLYSSNNKSSAGITASNNRQVKSQKITLNKTFDVPTGLESKEGGHPLKVTFQSALLTNRIFISGKPKYSKAGTTYLLINILVENDNTKSINFKTRDTVRLIDPNGKKFAPSFYNKIISVQADAVKKDVVGFLVPDNIKDFQIQYGIPTGQKQTLQLKFNQ